MGLVICLVSIHKSGIAGQSAKNGITFMNIIWQTLQNTVSGIHIPVDEICYKGYFLWKKCENSHLRARGCVAI